MPVFVEDPAQFSKQRLKSELVANNVALPGGESKKQVYLDLYLKYVSKGAADFSSDEEEQVQGNDVEDPGVRGEEEEEQEEQEEQLDEMDVTQLTDEELKAQLLQFGVKVGPIVGSTRALYERKLERLLDPALQPNQNGTGEGDQYSDSEEDDEEEDEPGCDCEPPPGQDPVTVAVVTGPQHAPPTSQQLESRSLNSSSRAAMESRSSWGREQSPWAREQAAPANDVLAEMFPDADPTPTGIVATRRRPIKGAAGRPVVYKYPTTPLGPASPLSPASLEQRELRRWLVPVWVQVLVFLGVAALLYLIYGAVEDGLRGPFAGLLDNLNQGAEPAEEPPPLPELQDSPAHLLPEEY